MNDTTGGSAFPAQPIYRMPDGTDIIVPQNGMTLRDYFAAKAMHAFLSVDGTDNFSTRARESYEMADAMIAARGNV